ncbi:cdc42 effector protein 1 [Sardina pilchardus]|uniref:cdc42 effector protein 1 n=1 Tax=Sardina pilchardus TaxID=27697 RepID=UPI002E144EE3
MNLGKLSGLKGLVSNSGGKRKFKGELTADMISPPLGDFRHTMHVGRGGDVFGDTSFLSNHGGSGSNGGDGGGGGSGEAAGSAPNTAPSTPGKTEGFFTRTLRHVRKTPDPRSPGSANKEPSQPPPVVSPIIKNAISLPRLDVDSPNGCPVKVLFPSSPKSPEDSSYSYGVESGFVTLPRLSRSERQQQGASSTCSPDASRGSLTDLPVLAPLSVPVTSSSYDPDSLSFSGSLTSFTLDLGPSLMSEVFSLIDIPRSQRQLTDTVPGDIDVEDEEEEEPDTTYDYPTSVAANSHPHPNSRPEVDSATVSLVDSLLREDYSGSKALYGLDWGEDESLRGSTTADRPLMGAGSSGRGSITSSGSSSGRHHAAQAMDAEHFQRATDVLARHYGSGGSGSGSSGSGFHQGSTLTDSTRSSQRRVPYLYPDEEEEIKV